MSMSAESARLTPEKIEFRCSCGKRYRVPARKAGRKVRCKRCRLKVRVPGDLQISLRTRKAVLAELGIDEDAAAKAYEAEKVRGYACTICAAKLAEDDLAAAYGQEGLVCSTCRAARVEARAETAERTQVAARKGNKKLGRWTRQVDPATATRRAAAYGALFFVGIGGLVDTLFAPHVAVTLLVAALVAGAGARAIYAAYTAPDAEA